MLPIYILYDHYLNTNPSYSCTASDDDDDDEGIAL